jgi:hypothetical protein
MGWFIFAVFLWVVAAVALAVSFLARKDARFGMRALGVIIAVIGFAMFAVGGLKSVPVKNIGVPQSFGAVGKGIYEPGIHETWTPWLHLTDIDETVQTTTFKDGGNDQGSSCNGGLPVRIGGQQTGCADITIQWQVLPAAAGSLFSDYANKGNLMDTIESAVVLREFEQVVNNRLGDYNPITDVQSASGTVTGSTTQTSQFTQFGPQILADMQHDIGNRVKVITVFMPQLHYSAGIEDKLAAIQQAYANYAIAQENVRVNAQQALALSKLGTPNLAQLVAQCLTDLKEDPNLPAGFQCIPGSGAGLALSAK